MSDIDELLGKVTMYRLLTYCLAAIAALSLVLMGTGYLPYAPLAFMASMILFVGVSYGANRLLGWLYGVRPHGESAIISGLIMALLFTPPTSLLAGVKLALVASIAMASKYVFVVRNRHVFNPAAVSVVLASVAGLAFATWWVATPALLPVTVLAAALILLKTKRLQMALVFLVVATSLIALQSVVSGGAPLESVVTVITSWPLVFVAGVMLSEPLTLPPRRWQQLTVAGIVAVLMSVPFHYASVTMTPALALVMGNFAAWWWGTRGAVKLRFVGKKPVGGSSYDFAFDVVSRAPFVPGQYMELSLPHHRADSRGMRRVFSIIGRPGSEQVSIGTKIAQRPSTFKRALMALKNGQTIYASRIAGDFVLPKDVSVPLVFVAGGIGITPFLSLIMAAGKRKVSVVYSVASFADLAYVRELSQYDVDVTVVSPDTGTLPDASWHHIQAPRLTLEVLRQVVPISDAPLVYVSGPPAMVNAVRRLVKTLGLRFKTDHFTGY